MLEFSEKGIFFPDLNTFRLVNGYFGFFSKKKLLFKIINGRD